MSKCPRISPTGISNEISIADRIRIETTGDLGRWYPIMGKIRGLNFLKSSPIPNAAYEVWRPGLHFKSHDGGSGKPQDHHSYCLNRCKKSWEIAEFPWLSFNLNFAHIISASWKVSGKSWSWWRISIPLVPCTFPWKSLLVRNTGSISCLLRLHLT